MRALALQGRSQGQAVATTDLSLATLLKTAVPLHGNFKLHPLWVAMGNAFSVTRVWRYICKNTTCWPATAHDVTTGATTIKGPPGEKFIILFFVFTDCFVWSVHSGKSTVFSLSWRALARRLRLCVNLCPLYLTPDDTHNLCVFYLGKEHARDVLEGKNLRALWAFSFEKAPLSSVPLFKERGAAVYFPQFGIHRCRGDWNRGVHNWIWPMS